MADVVANDPSRRKWEDLEGDLLSEIFGRLDLLDRLVSVPFVCKPWRRASLLPRCWRVLDFHESYEALVLGLLRAYRLRRFTFSGLLKLLLPRTQGSATHVFLPPAVYFDFDLGHRVPLAAEDWEALWGAPDDEACAEEELEALANKTRYSRKGSYYDHIAEDLLHMSSNVMGWEEMWITREDLEVLSTECPRLRLIAIPSSVWDFGRYICELVGRWKELECCAIGGYTYYARELLTEIGNNCKSLETLQLIRTDKLDAPATYSEVGSALVEYTPNLKRLYLWGFQMDEEDLLHLRRGCKHLDSVSVRDYHQSFRCSHRKHLEAMEGPHDDLWSYC